MMKDGNSSSSPRAGDILVAHPGMPENLFARTLVYLHTFSTDGAMGFILNRPLGQSLDRMSGGSALKDILEDVPLFFGGPVHADHFILTRFLPEPEAVTFRCEMNPDPDVFLQEPAPPGSHLRACMGYAGWSAGQLEEEIRRGDWTWIPSDQALLHHLPGAQLWELAATGDRRWQRLRPHLPPEPERN